MDSWTIVKSIMPAIKIINKTSWDISFLKDYALRLKPFVKLVNSKNYPFEVIVVKKKDFYDRSTYDLNTHKLTFKIDLSKQSKNDISWAFIHEFCHFLTANNLELKKTCLSEEQQMLEKILEKKYNINTDQIHEIFHDLLPVEVAANFFATMLVGKFHKRHPFSNITKFLKRQK